MSLKSWLLTTDHKKIGIMYIIVSILFVICGTGLSDVIRLQLAHTDLLKGHYQLYNVVMTLHGVFMVFGFVMPAAVGFANYLIPLMIGAPDMAFPRLNNVSFWLLLSGFGLICASPFIGEGPGTGWTLYPPLSNIISHSSISVDLLLMGLAFTGMSSILGAINFVVTVCTMRIDGMGWKNLPLFPWSMLCTSFMILIAMPVLATGIVMLIFDRHFGTSFFSASGGGDPVLFQHIFWFFGHPEVYIVILPGFGIISHVISTFSQRRVVGYSIMVMSLCAISILGCVVWAHHMFTTGMSISAAYYFAIASMAIGVPTGMKIFSWIFTMWGGVIRFTTPMLFAIGFLFLFTFGGITGIILANGGIDVAFHDTYYVVAHFHYVMAIAAVFALIAGFYYWAPLLGIVYNEMLGKIHFWWMFIGINITFLPQHLLGIAGMPRRVPDYPHGFHGLNVMSSVGAFISAGSLLWFLYIIYDMTFSYKAVNRDHWGCYDGDIRNLEFKE